MSTRDEKMAGPADCRTCVHNGYLYADVGDFIDCIHPVAMEKGPRWQKGDPAIVNWRTADVAVRDIPKMGECPTYERAPSLIKERQ